MGYCMGKILCKSCVVIVTGFSEMEMDQAFAVLDVLDKSF